MKHYNSNQLSRVAHYVGIVHQAFAFLDETRVTRRIDFELYRRNSIEPSSLRTFIGNTTSFSASNKNVQNIMF